LDDNCASVGDVVLEMGGVRRMPSLICLIVKYGLFAIHNGHIPLYAALSMPPCCLSLFKTAYSPCLLGNLHVVVVVPHKRHV